MTRGSGLRSRSVHRALIASGLALALGACGDDTAGDPFPIAVERAGGAFVVGLQAEGEDFVRTAVVDVLSPLTILDQAANLAPTRRGGTLDLLEPEQADGSRVARVRWDTTVLGLHP